MKWILSFLLLALPAMAGREFVNASSRHATNTLPPISLPITLAAWCVPKQKTAALVVLSLNTTTNATERLQIYYDGSATGDPFVASVATSGGAVSGAFGTGSETNQWYHVAGVFASSTERVVWVNGSPEGTNTTSRVVDGLDMPAVGARKSTTMGAFWTGTVAEAAIWSAALTAGELSALASGASPLMVRPASLVFYAPLTGRDSSTEWNIEGQPLTLFASPTTSDHPRIYKP